MQQGSESEPGSREAFPLTRWSLITRVRQGSAEEVGVAMEELCQRYWYPIYAFLRREGHDRPDAEDLVQGFFARMLASESFQRAEQDRGKLRTFLLGSLQHYLIDEIRFKTAQKRGGGRTVVSIDEKGADGRYLREPAEEVDPALLFEKTWAQELLGRAIDATRRDYVNRGKGEVFDTLREFVGWHEKEVPYRQAARELGVKEGALRVTIFRLRQRFRQALEKEIAETVSEPAEIEAELAYLRKLVAA